MAAFEREDELLKPAVVKKLAASIDVIEPASKVVHVRSDSTVTTKLEAPSSIADERELLDLVGQWGIKRQVNQLLSALGLPVLDSVD